MVKLTKKNKILPFEDEHTLEFLAHKNDASLFMLGTSNKKRPNNVVMGRMFDFHVLDMIEYSIFNFRSASEFAKPSPGVGMRPCFVFCGDEFESNPEMKRFGNMMLDFFGGRPTSMINLRGLENVIVLTAVQGVVHFHHYTVALQASGARVPRVELEDVGPSFEACLGRSKLATGLFFKLNFISSSFLLGFTFSHISLLAPHLVEGMWRKAVIVDPRKTRDPSRPQKNVEIDTLGTRLGTVHVGSQDLSTLILKKGKALRKSNKMFLDGKQGNEDGSLKGSKKKQKTAPAPEADPTDM